MAVRSKPFKYTKEHKKFISDNYKGISSKELTEMFNERFDETITVKRLQSYKSTHKLNSGYNTQFKKGEPSPLKGKTWDDFLTKEQQIVSSRTLFKKGFVPSNRLPIGSESFNGGYCVVKIAQPDVWKEKHRLVWEEANGKMPADHRITFLDGDKTNCKLENLTIISLQASALMAIYKYHSEIPEMTSAGILLSELQIKSNELNKS